MAGTLSAGPRLGFALAQLHRAIRYGLSNLGEVLRQQLSPRHVGFTAVALMAILAAVALTAILAVMALTSAGALPMLLILLCVLAALLALEPGHLAAIPALIETRGPEKTAIAEIAATAPPLEASPEPQSPAPNGGALVAVEKQSRSLIEIAGAVTRARRAGEAEAKGQVWDDLMARVSHDLRTPLNAVIGFSDVMNSELLGPVGHPRYREYAGHIRDCGRELLKSAEDTLAITSLLARPEFYGRAGPLDLAGLAQDAWGFFSSTIERRGIRLEVSAPDGLEVLGERRPLRQILINLFSEALSRADDNGLIVLNAIVDGDLVQLEVNVQGARQIHVPAPGSLAICLARALLELQGASLVEVNDRSCAWGAVTVLGRAAQPDFFDVPGALRALPAHIC
jgi:signal transduction histidine kinase